METVSTSRRGSKRWRMPGSVFISQTVFSHVKGKTNLGFEDLGERSLKNMAEPVRVYRLSGPLCSRRPRPRPLRSICRRSHQSRSCPSPI